MHKLVVALMLAVTTIMALLYVSTFPAPDEAATRGTPAMMLESDEPSGGLIVPKKLRLDPEALRHLA